jgi:uncharacterized membrane protein
MARLSARHRRPWRRHLRTLLYAVLLLGALPGLVAAGLAGDPGLLWLIPVGMVGAVLGAPIALAGLALMLLPLLVVLLVFGGPLFLAYRILDDRRRGEGFPAEVRLRRRYVAGELGYVEFREEMLGHLKERFARGELRLPDYEAEVERLLRPGRQLDAGRDPTLSGPLRVR